MLGRLRQELGLEGLSSLAQHCRARYGNECCACQDLREMLAHHKFRPVGYCGAGRGLQKIFNVLNSGVNLTDNAWPPRAPGCFLRPTPQPSENGSHQAPWRQDPAREGLVLAGGPTHLSFGCLRQRKKRIKRDHGLSSTMHSPQKAPQPCSPGVCGGEEEAVRKERV